MTPRLAAEPVGRWRRGLRQTYGEAAGAALVLAYLALVAVLEIARSTASWPNPSWLASSPSGVASGDVPSLLTSGFVVAGAPALQIVGTVLTLLLVLHRVGARVFWATALAAHVGATLVAYVGVAILWFAARGDVDGVLDAPDYGTSCVWAGGVGALLASALARRHPRVLAVVALATGSLLAVVPPSGGLAATEHGLAFVLGAGTAAALLRRRAALRRATLRGAALCSPSGDGPLPGRP